MTYMIVAMIAMYALAGIGLCLASWVIEDSKEVLLGEPAFSGPRSVVAFVAFWLFLWPVGVSLNLVLFCKGDI